MNKTELLNQLSTGVTTVTFTKKDGSLRTMNCTRNLSVIPAEHQPKGETQIVTEETDNIRVFDVDANGWRSFNFSTLKV